jgi:RNA polymerase sigma factor (sigma-70 family)
MNAAARDLQTLFEVGSFIGLSDGQLLDRFVERREGAVFEAIAQRHGPMVWGVCRRVLQDHHDAEDAFQATFLVLARRASSVLPREKLGNWLYGVAYQTARKARAMRAKRRVREGQVPDMPEPEAASPDLRDDLTEQLDQELSRLPRKYRIPIVLCDLEGRTHKEAASQLGWPIGTVSSRLSRGRSMLERRLSHRGVSLAAGSLAALLAQESASAGMPTPLIGSTAQAASVFAVGGALTVGMVSAEVTALTGEVLKIMLLSKLKITVAALFVGGTLTVVGTSLAYQEQSSQKGSGGSDQKENLAAQKRVVPPALPGNTESMFGGGPSEPLYQRHGDLFFVTSALGDTFSIYDAATKRASTVRLPGSKESPLRVVPTIGPGNLISEPPLRVAPTIGPGNLISLQLAGPKLTRLYVFSLVDWKWYPQDLKEPVKGTLSLTLGDSVAAYTQGRTIYAFSGKAKRWSILELPPEAPAVRRTLYVFNRVDREWMKYELPKNAPTAQPDMTVSADSVVVEGDGHIYEFSGKIGEWKHTDLRSLIDAAIKASEDRAE